MTVNVVTNVHYQLAQNINEVKSGENVLFITDDIIKSPLEKTNSNPMALGNYNGNVMAVENEYKNDIGTIRHEQGHNLGFDFANNPNDPIHSKEPGNYMNAKGGRQNAGSTPGGVLKSAFGSFLNISDGKWKMGTGDAKNNSQKFLDKNNIQYDREKAKKAGVR